MFDEIKGYTIFFKNGNIMTIDAYNFNWYDDSIDFYLTKEDYENEGEVFASFMPQYIYAVSESKYIHYDKSTLFPVEAIVITKEEKNKL